MFGNQNVRGEVVKERNTFIDLPFIIDCAGNPIQFAIERVVFIGSILITVFASGVETRLSANEFMIRFYCICRGQSNERSIWQSLRKSEAPEGDKEE
jgi:hypothetical protein